MKKVIIGNLLFTVVVFIIITISYYLIRSKKLTAKKKIYRIIGVLLILSIVSFPFLISTWNPLKKMLQVGEFYILFNELEFWIEKSPRGNYYNVYVKYSKNTKEALGFGHGIYFNVQDKGSGFNLIFNPEDKKIYGKALKGGGWYDTEGKIFGHTFPKEWKEKGRVIYMSPEWEFYRLGEGKFEGGIFKPIFPKGTKFSFVCPEIFGEILEMDKMSHFITIHITSMEKLNKEELEKSSLSKIFKFEISENKGI